MNPRVKTLANHMKTLRDNGERFVLMLGAGASLSSGIPPTSKIIAELLDQRGSHIPGTDAGERFDQLWRTAQPSDRELFLKPYLDREPGDGYRRLAKLIEQGYFDCILSFNFDRLLEKALQRAGLQPGEHFLSIVRGDYTNEAVVQMMERQTPPVKLLKLHGSLTGGNNFLFSDVEMLNYPEAIRKLVESITSRHIIVCGYAFEDMCVQRAFAEQGGPIYCVNPTGRPSKLRPFVTLRASQDFTIDGESGKFDNFLEELEQALTEQVPAPPPRTNPFKYLGSLCADDRDALHGREKEIRDLEAYLASAKPVFVMGPAKAGKTSLTRAGLLCRLDTAKYVPLYLRCRGDVTHSITQLRRLAGLPESVEGIAPILTAVAEAAARQAKRAVLVLDQFERVHQYPDTAEGFEQLAAALRPLLEFRHPSLTVICVTADHPGITRAILRLKDLWDGPVYVSDLERKQVRQAVEASTARAGVAFDPGVLERLEEEYAKGRESTQGFTLAHVQALCSVLCEKPKVDLDQYEKVLVRERPVLDIVINQCDIVNLIEDLPPRDATLLRKIIRDVSHPECNQKVVDCVKQINEMANGAPKSGAAKAGR